VIIAGEHPPSQVLRQCSLLAERGALMRIKQRAPKARGRAIAGPPPAFSQLA